MFAKNASKELEVFHQKIYLCVSEGVLKLSMTPQQWFLSVSLISFCLFLILSFKSKSKMKMKSLILV